MKAFLLALAGAAALGGVVAWGGADDAAVKKDLKALAGRWKIDSLENPQGKDPSFEGVPVVFQEVDMEFTKDGETKKARIKINPAGKPREIDITPEGKDEFLPGIYAVEGKTLKLCLMMDPNGARPNTFEAKEKQVLVVLKRAD